MRRTILILTLVLAATGLVSTAYTQDNTSKTGQIVRKKLVTEPNPELNEMVKVGKDTVPLVVADRNWGRYDRGLFNYLYIPRGHWAIGLTASYGELGSNDIQLLSVLKNVDFNGKLYSIKPSASYFFKNNQSLGIRLNYTHGSAELGNLSVDIDDDMNFNIRDVGYTSNNFKAAVFYRNYVGLNRQKIFAVFNELSLEMGGGTSNFKRYYDGVLYDTRTDSKSLSLNFSPGVCLFLHDYVAFNVSFGVFGLKVNKDDQKTNGIDDGKRVSSGANFRFNIFNIDFGLMIVI